MVSWMEHVAYEERTRAVFVQPGEKRQRRDHVAICNYKVGGDIEEMETDASCRGIKPGQEATNRRGSMGNSH